MEQRNPLPGIVTRTKNTKLDDAKVAGIVREVCGDYKARDSRWLYKDESGGGLFRKDFAEKAVFRAEQKSVEAFVEVVLKLVDDYGDKLEKINKKLKESATAEAS